MKNRQFSLNFRAKVAALLFLAGAATAQVPAVPVVSPAERNVAESVQFYRQLHAVLIACQPICDRRVNLALPRQLRLDGPAVVIEIDFSGITHAKIE